MCGTRLWSYTLWPFSWLTSPEIAICIGKTSAARNVGISGSKGEVSAGWPLSCQPQTDKHHLLRKKLIMFPHWYQKQICPGWPLKDLGACCQLLGDCYLGDSCMAPDSFLLIYLLGPGSKAGCFQHCSLSIGKPLVLNTFRCPQTPVSGANVSLAGKPMSHTLSKLSTQSWNTL